MGNLFANLVVLEVLKTRLNQGKIPQLYFTRDSNGNEIDLLHVSGRSLTGVEIKSSATYHASFKKQLVRFHEQVKSLKNRYVVYSGEPLSFSDGIRILNFNDSFKVVDI